MMKRMKIKYKTPCGLYFEYEGRILFIDWRALGEAMLNNHMGETLNIASACAIAPSSMLVVMTPEEIARLSEDE